MKPNLSKEIISESDESGSESSGSSSVSEVPSRPEKSTKTLEPKLKPKPKSKSKERAVSVSSENSSASASSSESESEASTPEVNVTSKDRPPKKPSTKKVTIQESETVLPLPAKAYKPPEGFKFMQKASSSASNTISKNFSNLDGKQIWHITAPDSVPISSIKRLALDAVATGESILSHNGADYRLHEDQLGLEKTKSLLLPDKHGNVYRRKVGVAQTFHVEQILGQSNGGSLYTAESTNGLTSSNKPPRKQPKHLRMRYKPFGSADGKPETIGSSSEDSEMEDVVYTMPKGANTDQSVKKRKPLETELALRDSLTRKKSKRSHAHPPSEDPELSQPAMTSSDKRGRTDKIHSPEARQKSSKKHRDETSQERRSRREEKKRKKQHK